MRGLVLFPPSSTGIFVVGFRSGFWKEESNLERILGKINALLICCQRAHQAAIRWSRHFICCVGVKVHICHWVFSTRLSNHHADSNNHRRSVSWNFFSKFCSVLHFHSIAKENISMHKMSCHSFLQMWQHLCGKTLADLFHWQKLHSFLHPRWLSRLSTDCVVNSQVPFVRLYPYLESTKGSNRVYSKYLEGNVFRRKCIKMCAECAM